MALQYNRKIHWACCAGECWNDHHWEASLRAYSAMPSLVSYSSSFPYCQRIKWCLIPYAKAFLQTNHSQTEKAIRKMQLAYKGNWMHHCRHWKDILRLTARKRSGAWIFIYAIFLLCVLFIFHIMFVLCRHNSKMHLPQSQSPYLFTTTIGRTFGISQARKHRVLLTPNSRKSPSRSFKNRNGCRSFCFHSWQIPGAELKQERLALQDDAPVLMPLDASRYYNDWGCFQTAIVRQSSDLMT